MIIRQLQPEDVSEVLDIAQGLPEWFDEDARYRAIPIDLRHQEGFIALQGGKAVGFITLYVSEGHLNIGWLGVCKENQRQAIGALLLKRAEEYAKELGICEMVTLTLGDSVDYAPYEQTRAFYFKNGFTIYQRSKTDNPSCPEEIRIKKDVAP